MPSNKSLGIACVDHGLGQMVLAKLKCMTYLYGLGNSNKDFTIKESFGKNTFTNAFPLAVAQYIAIEKNLSIPVISAALGSDGLPTTVQKMESWRDIIRTDPANAQFNFEFSYNGYQHYSHGVPNNSDVVVIDKTTGEHRRPLEVKLVVVPTSDSAPKERDQQTCEIVSRPPTIEQVVFSIAHAFGPTRRFELLDLLTDALEVPNDYKWNDESYMLGKIPNVVAAVRTLTLASLDIQTPLVLVAVWRSQGQLPIIEEDHAYDVFVWTEMAFVQLYLDSVTSGYLTNTGTLRNVSSISRSARALIWIVRALWDYATQRTLKFDEVKQNTVSSRQSDKAAAFAGNATLRHMMSDEFLYPRVPGSETNQIFDPAGHGFLLPERRLDAALSARFTLERASND